MKEFTIALIVCWCIFIFYRALNNSLIEYEEQMAAKREAEAETASLLSSFWGQLFRPSEHCLCLNPFAPGTALMFSFFKLIAGVVSISLFVLFAAQCQ